MFSIFSIRSDDGWLEQSPNDSPCLFENAQSTALNFEETLLDLSNLSIEGGNYSSDENIGTEANTKTVTMREYTDLVLLIPQVEEYKNTIKQLKEDILKKNVEIQELKRSRPCDQVTEKNLSCLSDVRIHSRISVFIAFF